MKRSAAAVSDDEVSALITFDGFCTLLDNLPPGLESSQEVSKYLLRDPSHPEVIEFLAHTTDHYTKVVGSYETKLECCDKIVKGNEQLQATERVKLEEWKQKARIIRERLQAEENALSVAEANVAQSEKAVRNAAAVVNRYRKAIEVYRARKELAEFLTDGSKVKPFETISLSDIRERMKLQTAEAIAKLSCHTAYKCIIALVNMGLMRNRHFRNLWEQEPRLPELVHQSSPIILTGKCDELKLKTRLANYLGISVSQVEMAGLIAAARSAFSFPTGMSGATLNLDAIDEEGLDLEEANAQRKLDSIRKEKKRRRGLSADSAGHRRSAAGDDDDEGKK